MKRRNFLSNSTKALSGLVIGGQLSALNYQSKAKSLRFGANDKIRVGVIGCKGMGWSDTTSFLKMPQVEIIALCDVDNNVLTQ